MFSSNATQVSSAANYIEDVFSTWLYTGTGASQTITNGVDISSKGGLVWMKGRSGATDHALYDTARGATFDIATNLTTAQTTQATGLTAFGTTGFTIGSLAKINSNGATYVSWTFREQAKFFDVVTYTGTGGTQNVSHNLGSVPGCIIVKRIAANSNWQVYHRGLTSAAYSISINSTAAEVSNPTCWNSTTPTSSVFTVGANADVNGNGASYVAYLFAHDAGGFGATNTDNVISCGSWTQGASASQINLGWGPQWILVKKTNGVDSWQIVDTMRGWTETSGNSEVLIPNSSGAAASATKGAPNATGFTTSGWGLTSGDTAIYIAIRRGPMKTPTTGTSVFSAKLYSATTTSASVTHDVTFDAEINANRTVIVDKFLLVDSLRGINGQSLTSSNINAEVSFPTYWARQSQRTMYAPSTFDGWWASSSGTNLHVSYGLVRAPGFFDIVCYTGTGVNRTVTHNLGVVPELMLVKARSGVFTGWQIYSSGLANTEYLVLNTTAAKATSATRWNSTTPTSSVFSLGTAAEVNTNVATYVAYLFATVAGVSKVGSYTGTGTTKQIDCGFTGGARFVLIKRTDSTGDWYVWDSARGIVAGIDPYLLLNSTAAEVASTDYVDTYSAGFEISSTAPAAINANGGTFIFLAIA